MKPYICVINHLRFAAMILELRRGSNDLRRFLLLYSLKKLINEFSSLVRIRVPTVEKINVQNCVPFREVKKYKGTVFLSVQYFCMISVIPSCKICFPYSRKE